MNTRKGVSRAFVVAAVTGAALFVPQVLAQDASSLVTAAIEAHGGESALEKLRDGEFEYDVEVTFGTNEMTGSMTLSVREGEMLKREGLIESRGGPFEFVSAATKSSAWRRAGRRIYDVPVDEFALWLSHRADMLLRAGDGELSLAGTSEVDGAEVTLVDFTEKSGSTRIGLDRSSGRVRSIEYRATVSQGMGNSEEVLYKRIYGDYRDVDGVPLPHRVEEYEDGVRNMVMTLTGATLGEAPPLERFAKPAPDDEAKEWGDQIAN